MAAQIFKGKGLVMKSNVCAAVLVIVMALLATKAVEARRPSWGGHQAIAVSPDGKIIAVGGASRTLYIVDAETMQVTHRQWHGAQIGALAFNADGSVLILEDETATVHLLDSQSRDTLQSIKDADYISLSMAGDRMAVLTARGRKLAILSTEDGETLRELELPDGFRSGGHVLHPDGHRVAILSQSFDQPVPEGVEAPADLPQGHARLFQDGKASRLLIYDADTGEQLADHTLWYTSQGSDRTSLAFLAEEVIVFNYNAVNVRVDEHGNIQLLEGLPRFGYGRGVSLDHTQLATGSLASGAVGVLSPDGFRVTEFKLADRLPGWPEYFAGFAFAPDAQSVYGVTSAFRLIHIRTDGEIVASVPVY